MAIKACGLPAAALGSPAHKRVLADAERLLAESPGHGSNGSGAALCEEVLLYEGRGAALCVGNEDAAEDTVALLDRGVMSLVYCGDLRDDRPNLDWEPVFECMTFPIGGWRRDKTSCDGDVGTWSFFKPVFAFVDASLSSGKGVLVYSRHHSQHADTVAAALLMLFAKLGTAGAAEAKEEWARRVMQKRRSPGAPPLLEALDRSLMLRSVQQSLRLERELWLAQRLAATPKAKRSLKGLQGGDGGDGWNDFPLPPCDEDADVDDMVPEECLGFLPPRRQELESTWSLGPDVDLREGAAPPVLLPSELGGVGQVPETRSVALLRRDIL